MTDSDARKFSSPIRLSALDGGKDHGFDLSPDAGGRAAMADDLDIRGIKKLRFAGRLIPQGRHDWRLEAQLGATVVQDCVVTLAPVTTRIDESVTRIYLRNFAEPTGAEVEIPEDDSAEPLPEMLDLTEVMAEALSLALPPFPRTEGADLGEVNVTEPGRAAMTYESARPFAGLAALKKDLENKGGTED